MLLVIGLLILDAYAWFARDLERLIRDDVHVFYKVVEPLQIRAQSILPVRTRHSETKSG